MTAHSYSARPTAAPIVLISGGTAMTASARLLAQYTKHSCHFLSPFDSGGSSAEFRRHFALPALGDLRSRLLALSNTDSPLHRQRAACLSQRMDLNPVDPLATLLHWKSQAAKLAAGEPAWQDMFAMTVEFGRQHLPHSFNWRQASLGNLALAAGMVVGGMSLDEVTARANYLLQCRGQARCMVADDLQLKVRLRSGRELVGQHNFTGKQTAALSEPIEQLSLCQEQAPAEAVSCQISEATRALLLQAKLIVLCPGSFYSSLMAQLLPDGVCAAIRDSGARTIYAPNLGHDPELIGCPPQQALTRLQSALAEDQHAAKLELLIDPSQANGFAESHHCNVHQHALATSDGQRHDPDKFSQVLWHLAKSCGISAL